MISEDISKKICSILDSKKAIDVRMINIKEVSVLADYIVIATGTSSTHVRALSEEVEYKLKGEEIFPKGIEGQESNSWVLIDYGNVIVNIFSEEARSLYNIEELWSRALVN